MRRSSVAIKVMAWIMVISLSQVFVAGKTSKVKGKVAAKDAAGVIPANAEMPLGRLVADGPVTINGVKARTGDTVFPGAQIQTVAGIGATVQIGRLGQIDISPDTSLLLNYDRGSILTEINMGCAVVAANDGVQGVLTMPGGITKKTDLMKNSPLSACSDMTAAGAKSVKMGSVASGAVTLGGGSVSFAEFGSMMLSSTGLVTGLSAVNQPAAVAAAANTCCCCCCCCDPSASVPCRK